MESPIFLRGPDFRVRGLFEVLHEGRALGSWEDMVRDHGVSALNRSLLHVLTCGAADTQEAEQYGKGPHHGNDTAQARRANLLAIRSSVWFGGSCLMAILVRIQMRHLVGGEILLDDVCRFFPAPNGFLESAAAGHPEHVLSIVPYFLHHAAREL